MLLVMSSGVPNPAEIINRFKVKLSNQGLKKTTYPLSPLHQGAKGKKTPLQQPLKNEVIFTECVGVTEPIV